MNEYEVYVEESTPCGGSKYAKSEFFEVEADSPEAYVRVNGKWPILDIGRNGDGELFITTGDCAGNLIKYTFSE